MITIEHLEVLFEAEREGDEAKFAQLFAQHIARHEAARRSSCLDDEQGAADRSLGSA